MPVRTALSCLRPAGTELERLDYRSIRPALEKLKLDWHNLIGNQPGFYLEDKGWSLAIHARFAPDQEVDTILSAARTQANPALAASGLRLLGGHKFLEICPRQADKGETLGAHSCPGDSTGDRGRYRFISGMMIKMSRLSKW